jgi:hypothetical protein
MHGGSHFEFDTSLVPTVLCDPSTSTDASGAAASFSLDGDSGSAVYDSTGALIGIIVGWSEQGSAFCPIQAIMTKLDLTAP